MKCPTCQREIEPGEVTWPGDELHSTENCQDCWEAECSIWWWEMYGKEGDHEVIGACESAMEAKCQK